MKSSWRAALRDLAESLDRIDVDVYRQFDRDPLEPVVGMGDPDARLAIFGRDPGREEVRHQIPFVGAGGQKVRAVLYEVMAGRPMESFEASLEVGRHAFWANTVPYKPIGNKAWSQAVKKRFQPWMARILLDGWRGRDVLTLGRVAFFWFSLGQDRELKREQEAYWRRPDRFQAAMPLSYAGPDGQRRQLTLHPLPHPSPLNAVWYRRFPALLAERLRQLEFGPGNWRID